MISSWYNYYSKDKLKTAGLQSSNVLHGTYIHIKCNNRYYSPSMVWGVDNIIT